MESPVSLTEIARRAALRRYSLHDTHAEQDFDDLTFLASLICGTPIAMITLVGQDRLWIKSCVGMDIREAPLEGGFSAYAILNPSSLMVVRDAREDPRFAENALVRFEPRVRFYAGRPLIAPDGYALGAICVMDRIPRDLSPVQREAMSTLARQVIAQLELRRDVAERKAAQAATIGARQAAEAARSAAEEANRAKSAFLANMSHELRTPLNAIIGYSEMLQEEARDEGHERYLSDLEKIRAAGKHLLSTINDVLDLSKVEAGKTNLHAETFNVDLLVRDVVGAMRPAIERGRNRFEVDCRDGVGTMRSDPTKLRQCLFNVLGNAGKFTEQGVVRMEVWRETEAGADWLTFRVSDTGIGITPEQVSRLFEPFAQADSSIDRRYGGTGLGLSITRQFCRLMGGDIHIEKREGPGATFTIHLPSERVEHAKFVPTFTTPAPAPLDTSRQLVPAIASSASHASNPLILIVDDDSDARELMSRFLAREGYRVTVAATGAECLRHAAALEPAAIVLDVMMPGIDGWAILTALKTDSRLAEIPVVIVTMVDDPARGFRLGAAEYLVKPVDRNRLAEVLQQYKRDKANLPILVVEDDAAVREMIHHTIASEGWRVIEAKDGIDALRAVAERRPALILLDLMMPRMNGFEFVTELRKTESWRSIPIVVMTAHQITDADRRQLDGCVQAVLEKSPWSREALLAEVAEQIGRRVGMDAVS